MRDLVRLPREGADEVGLRRLRSAALLSSDPSVATTERGNGLVLRRGSDRPLVPIAH